VYFPKENVAFNWYLYENLYEEETGRTEVYIAFAGTRMADEDGDPHIANVLTDLTPSFEPLEFHRRPGDVEQPIQREDNVLTEGSRVHRGFLRAYGHVRQHLWALLNDDCRLHGVETITLTGHSLGGALATLAAVDISMHRREASIKLVTWGAPTVGDRRFRTLFSGLNLHQSTRWYVNSWDPVAELTPWVNWGSVHTECEWIVLDHRCFYPCYLLVGCVRAIWSLSSWPDPSRSPSLPGLISQPHSMRIYQQNFKDVYVHGKSWMVRFVEKVGIPLLMLFLVFAITYLTRTSFHPVVDPPVGKVFADLVDPKVQTMTTIYDPELNETNIGCPADVRLFGGALSAFALIGNTTQVSHLVHHPDFKPYCESMKNCGASHTCEDYLLRSMFKQPDEMWRYFIEVMVEGNRDLHAYNIALYHAAVIPGDMVRARKLFEKLNKKLKPNAWTYSSMISVALGSNSTSYLNALEWYGKYLDEYDEKSDHLEDRLMHQSHVNASAAWACMKQVQVWSNALVNANEMSIFHRHCSLSDRNMPPVKMGQSISADDAKILLEVVYDRYFDDEEKLSKMTQLACNEMMKWLCLKDVPMHLSKVNSMFKTMGKLRLQYDEFNAIERKSRFRSDYDICVPNMWTHGEVMRAREVSGEWEESLRLYKTTMRMVEKNELRFYNDLEKWIKTGVRKRACNQRTDKTLFVTECDDEKNLVNGETS